MKERWFTASVRGVIQIKRDAYKKRGILRMIIVTFGEPLSKLNGVIMEIPRLNGTKWSDELLAPLKSYRSAVSVLFRFRTAKR
jgi:hypothetical protein